MSIRSRLVAGGCALIVAGVAPAVLAQASTSCTFTDATGDATQLLVANPTVYSEPTLDLVELGATWDQGSESVEFTIEVVDLKDTPPVGANGDYFEFHFAVGNDTHFVTAGRSLVGGEEFALSTVENSLVTDIAPLTGSYDVDADTITIVLPAVIEADGETLFALESGAVLGTFDVNSRRRIGEGLSLITVTDEAAAAPSCTTTLGTVTPPTTGGGPTVPVLDTAGDTEAFDGVVDAGAFGVCPTCAVHQVDVDTTGGGTLTVTFSSVDPDDDLTDLDIRVRGPNGLHQLSSEPGNGDSVTIELPADGSLDGRYRLTVVPYTAALASYTLSAALS